jgi:anti-sigma B factor antagonist
MRDVRFPIEVVSGVPVVAAPEEIDITSAPELRAALLEAAVRGDGTLVADLTRTRFCDASVLQVLLAAHKRATAGGGQLLLASHGTGVLRILAITGIDRVIPSFASLRAALAHTSASGPNGHHLATDAAGEPQCQLSARGADK